MAGGFFLFWAAVGWASYTANSDLRASLWARADPGPALVPIIVLSVLSLGGGFLFIRGIILTLNDRTPCQDQRALPPVSSHILPLGFAASLAVLAVAMQIVGFLPAAIAFCLFWFWGLSSEKSTTRAWLLHLVAAVTIGGGINFLFAGLLSVPLPS
ncbi:tripartite tricarboxylate transporter TctB family protein [Pararhodobacter oceanensis]